MAMMEIKGSPAKLVGLLALGLLMTGLSAAFGLGRLPGPPSAVAVGWLGLLFFGLCTVICLWRLLTAGRTVVTITSLGIKDVRVAANVVPWSGVRNISTMKVKGQKFIVLAVDPSIEKQLSLTRIAKWSRGPNRALGSDGLCVSAIGLKIGHDALLKACLANWRADRATK